MIISNTLLPIVAAALESSNTVVAVLDVGQGQARPFFVGVSGAFLDFCGHGFSDIIGQTIDLVGKPGTASLGAIAAAMQAGQAYRGDLACVAKDGTEKWLGLHIMPVGAGDGPGRHFVLIGRDISAQRREGAQARLIQNVLLKIFMASDAAIAIISADDRIIMANPHMDRLLGAAPGAFAGRHVPELVAPADRQRVADARATVGPGEVCRVEADLLAGRAGPVTAALRFTRLAGHDMAGVSTLFIRPRPPAAAPPQHLRMAGKIRFLSLDAVRSGMEDRWARVGARVIETAEALIRRHLGAQDTLARTDDRGFTICFGTASDDEATILAATMARDLLHHLIGHGEADLAERLTATVSQIPVAAQGAPDMRSIGRLMDEAEDAVQARAWPGPVCVPVLNVPNGSCAASLIGHPPRQAAGGRAVFPESTLDQALLGLKMAAGLGTGQWTLSEVDFALFLNKANAEAIEEACINLPVQLRERLYLALSPWPRGTTRSLLQDLLRRIGRFCGGFAVRLDDLQLPDFDLAATRPAAAILDMRRFGGGAAVPHDRLSRLTNLLGVYRVRALATHVTSLEAGRELGRLGVGWITLADAPP